MLLGHYGLAFAAKRAAPRTSLGTLAFAAEFLDELWSVLLLAGVERVRVAPGYTSASALQFVYYPWSHSLLMATLWAVVIGASYALIRKYRRGAIVVGLLVVSHWILDVPMHRPDLALWPASDIRVGLGAWSSIPLTVAIELVVFAAGLVVYMRSTRARDGIGRWALASMVILLLGIFLTGASGQAPPSDRAVAVGALGLWLFVPLGWWIDRHRDPRVETVTDERSSATAFAAG